MHSGSVRASAVSGSSSGPPESAQRAAVLETFRFMAMTCVLVHMEMSR